MRAPRRRLRRRQRGFTLIELMISLLLFSFVVAGVLALAVAMATSYREQRVTVATETSARGALTFLTDALRGMNPGANTGVVRNLMTCADTSPVVNNFDNGPDDITIAFSYGGVVSGLKTAYTGGNTLELIPDDAGNYDAFEDGDWIIITDGATGSLAKVDTAAGTTLTLTVSPCSPAPSYAPGALVIRAMYAQFYIAALDGIPTLFMDIDPDPDNLDAEPIAEGVEDMQIALGYDATTDGLMESADGTADEWAYNAAGETHPLPGTLRAVRVTLVARSLTTVTGASSAGVPDLEDRPARPADRYRRRILSTTVELRNMEGSP